MTQIRRTPTSSTPDATGVGARELLTLISAVMALMALGIDLMLPAFDDVRDAYELGDGSNRTGQIVTVFFIGLAVAQLFFGPLADRFGRKPVLYTGIGIYMAGAVGSALAPTFGLLLLSRFVWGVGAAGARVVAIAIIRDRFVGDAMAKAMSQVMAVFVLVPMVAPALGAGLIAIAPWRIVFWFCAVWAMAIAAWSLRLGETLAPDHVQPLGLANSLSTYRRIVLTPVTSGYTLATIFLQGAITLYLASSELLIGEIFDRDAEFPFVFGAIAATFGIAALVNGRYVEQLGLERIVSLALVVGVPLAIVLAVVSVGADGRPSFWVFIPLLACTLCTFMFLMPNLNTASMTPVGDIAGAASAFIGAVRMAGGAAIAIVTTGLIEDSTTPFAVTVSGLYIASAVTVVAVRRRTAST